jgi:hypothetical protein
LTIEQNFESRVGEDIRVRWTLDPVPSGGIAGWTFEFTARDAVADVAAFVTKTNANFTIEDAALGIFYCDIADTETDTTTGGATAGDYDYDVKRMDAGAEGTLAHGVWTLTNTATRDVA